MPTFELVTEERTVWYRTEDVRYAPPPEEHERPVGEGRTEVATYEFPVIKETACGVWLNTGSGKRFVLREARKRYACPTREEALASFVARKTRQLRILRAQIRSIEQALALAGAPCSD